MKRTIVILLLIIFAVGTIDARRNSTRRSGLKSDEPVEQPAVSCDTLIPVGDEVVLSGYAKALNASKETLFITNNTDGEILRIVFTISYSDVEGHELHRREVSRRLSIPAGATRKVDFTTWDPQHTFYFEGSRRPRVDAVPYRIAQRVDTIFLHR